MDAHFGAWNECPHCERLKAETRRRLLAAGVAEEDTDDPQPTLDGGDAA